MSDNVAQWLAEVRSLQQQVKTLEQEREQAYGSVENWRKLYEGEAQQRRRDAAASRCKIEQLEQAISTENTSENLLNDSQSSADPDSSRLKAEIATIENTQSLTALKAQLIATKRQCNQLAQQVKAEQEAHEQTRESLTAALGDTVNLLSKERTEAQL